MGQALESYWNKRHIVPGSARSMQAVAARHRLPSVILVMTAVMLILGCMSCYWRTAIELNTAVAEKDAEAARVDDLRIQTQRLAAQIERLKTDPKAVESLARQNLGFVRPGEIVLRIKPDLTGSEASIAGTVVSPRDQRSGSYQNGGLVHGTAATDATAPNSVTHRQHAG